jgi:hypothetical protein
MQNRKIFIDSKVKKKVNSIQNFEKKDCIIVLFKEENLCIKYKFECEIKF